MEVIPLRNRMVEEFVTIIRSLLGSNETVTGMRHQLIVHASNQKIREIKSLLEKNDGQLIFLKLLLNKV